MNKHPDKGLIDHGIANNVSLVSMAKRFDVSLASLYRHRQNLRENHPQYLRALTQRQPSLDEIIRRHAEACAGLRELENRKPT